MLYCRPALPGIIITFKFQALKKTQKNPAFQCEQVKTYYAFTSKIWRVECIFGMFDQ